ncbi:MAG: CPBP family intramembrane metalloprotease [Lachnospiraceae bacterium]|nr:CPBP family intramembrane metalloprotease [Lachnospiraceae bacterium]
MNLLGYYMSHSFINQIKKLLHTWVVVFILVCGLMGGVIGVGIGSMANHMDQESKKVEKQIKDKDKNKGQDPSKDFDMKSLMKQAGLDGTEMIELIAAVGIILLILFEAGNADASGSKIFLPADVPILFSSPMRSQSVLIFRLFTKMGTFIFLTIYLVVCNQAILSEAKISMLQELFLVVSWILIYITAKLVAVALYLDGSNHEKLKKNIRYGVLGVGVVIAVAFLLFFKANTLLPGQAAMQFFHAKGTNWIPVYGWLKGIVVETLEGSLSMSMIYMGLSLLLVSFLVFLIYGKKADYYESAMEAAEKMAEMQAKFQAARNGKNVSIKKKKRSKIAKSMDGIGHGWGSTVFFFKAMHTRFRTNGLGILTKTSVTYICVAIVANLFAKMMWHMSGVNIALIALGAFVFYRSMVNPLTEDYHMGYFIMIPENTWKKLGFSLFSGTFNCILDLIPALVILGVMERPDPYVFVMGIVILITMDFYATIVGVFVDASIPQSIDQVVRQMLQATFLYAGLIPDIILLLVGFLTPIGVKEMLPWCAVCNFGIGMIFYGVTPLLIDPMGVRASKPELSEYTGDRRKVRKEFTFVGLGATVMLLGSFALQYGIEKLVVDWAPSLLKSGEAVRFLLIFIPEYVIAFPVGILFMRYMKPEKIQEKKLGALNAVKAVPSILFMMVAGSFISLMISGILNLFVGRGVPNPVAVMATDGTSLPVQILFFVILAPLIEEFIFRKILIDRLKPYGEVMAIVISAMMFGLLHGNFAQMFYAFGIGLVFGTIYARTGRLRYSVICHMVVNLFGGIIAPAILNKAMVGMTLQSVHFTPWVIALIVYEVAIYVLGMIGFIVICIHVSGMRFKEQSKELPRGGVLTTVFGNPGMILYVISCLGMAIYSLHL